MTAEIINIGDEILIGQINNTNSQWLAQQLQQLGIETQKIKVIGDTPTAIGKALKEAQADVVVVTGGLGPTKDDLTKETITRFFKDRLIFHPEVEQHIKEMFAKMNYPYTDNNKGQAFLPSQAQILWNNYGTAPGMWLEKDSRIYIFLPGVPFEMKQIFTNEVIPRLKERFKLPNLYHKTVTVFGIGESLLADRIKKWEEELPDNIKLAYLPHPGRIRLRLSSKGNNLDALKKQIQEQIEKLKAIIPDLTLSEAVEDLSLAVHQKLTESGHAIAFAESCTGGLVVSGLAQIPGASKFLMGGIVAYNTKIKIKVLGVSPDLIDRYSVVHEAVAKAMAQSVQKLMQADIGVATTGNAGPTKGDSDAEVGTCIIAIAYKEQIKAFRYQFGQPREKAVKRTVSKAYELILNTLEPK